MCGSIPADAATTIAPSRRVAEKYDECVAQMCLKGVKFEFGAEPGFDTLRGRRRRGGRGSGLPGGGPRQALEVADMLGAGDAFAGGFLLACGGEPAAALRAGCDAGATGIGANCV
jgi:sugar/nucleoside kinase (ribokinase family)